MKRTILGALLGAGLAAMAVVVLDSRGEAFAIARHLRRLRPPTAT